MKTIFDIPDEILVEIILYLTPRERLPLSKSCTRFNSLVFGDKRTLRYLDFSEDGHSMSDVDEYFGNEITHEMIRGVNLHNVRIADRFSDSCIAKAINLVDLNLLGTKMDMPRLKALLNPLQHVRRLSFEWSESAKDTDSFDHQHVILQQRLGGLIYLSVTIMFQPWKTFVIFLKMCQELKELYIVGTSCYFDKNCTLPEEFTLPKSIEVVHYRGLLALRVKQRITELLSNPEEWTDFLNQECHMERNVPVCDELLDHGTVRCARYDPAKNPCNVGRVIILADLLREVVAIRHQNVPTEFCCLSKSGSLGGSCSMSIKDAKRLLKDSSYQLPSLRLHHRVEINCDVHLIASAFPYLTELYLSGIILDKSTKVERSFEERLMRKGDATPLREPRDSMNPDSSFARLVRNTPRLRHLTLAAKRSESESENWDIDGLGLISRWKSLETLDLTNIPLGDGRFLLEIAKQCNYLKDIRFFYGTFDETLRLFYEERFLDMFTSCENLRKISLPGYNLSKPSQMFSSLQNNPLIETIGLRFIEYEDTPDNLTRSIEQLLDRCSQLTRIKLEFKDVDKELAKAFQRSNGERSLRNVEISVNRDYLYLVRGQPSHPAHQVIKGY